MRRDRRKIRKLKLEPLEKRRVLATLTVTTLDDSGPGSLREAIEFANTNTGGASGADEIVFAERLSGSIFLQSQLPTVSDDLTITGPGRDQLTLDAGGGIDPNLDGDGFRVFVIADGDSAAEIDVAISEMTLTGADKGEDPGQPLTHGGAILSKENLTISNTTISGNRVVGSGGGIATMGYSDGNIIVSNISLMVHNSLISNNEGIGSGGIFAQGKLLVIQGSEISNNNSTHLAGGLTVTARTIASVTDSLISNNTSGHGGGGVSINGEATLTNTVVSNNTSASSGGGIFNAGSLTLIESVVSGNSADFGGGGINSYWARETRIERSTVSGNTAGRRGGGIYLYVAGATIVDSTLSGNSAEISGGAISVDSFGRVTVTNSTISGNDAPRGGGIRLSAAAASASIAYSTIFDNGIADEGDGGVEISNSILTEPIDGVVSGSFNLVAVDPGLGPLADNGGPTLTHAVLPDSPAVNAGDPNALPGQNEVPAQDQRGLDRVQGGRIDIGAYESNFDISWHNPDSPNDVNGDGVTSPLDALLVINELNDRQFSDPESGQLIAGPSPPPFLDVTNDGFVSPHDALAVIDDLDLVPTSGRLLAATRGFVFRESTLGDLEDAQRTRGRFKT